MQLPTLVAAVLSASPLVAGAVLEARFTPAAPAPTATTLQTRVGSASTSHVAAATTMSIPPVLDQKLIGSIADLAALVALDPALRDSLLATFKLNRRSFLDGPLPDWMTDTGYNPPGNNVAQDTWDNIKSLLGAPSD